MTYLYVALALFSRKLVVWEVRPCEGEDEAAALRNVVAGMNIVSATSRGCRTHTKSGTDIAAQSLFGRYTACGGVVIGQGSAGCATGSKVAACLLQPTANNS